MRARLVSLPGADVSYEKYGVEFHIGFDTGSHARCNELYDAWEAAPGAREPPGFSMPARAGSGQDRVLLMGR